MMLMRTFYAFSRVLQFLKSKYSRYKAKMRWKCVGLHILQTFKHIDRHLFMFILFLLTQKKELSETLLVKIQVKYLKSFETRTQAKVIIWSSFL